MKIKIDDPLKILPPQGSYAASFRQGNRQDKAIIEIGEKGLRFYPLKPEAAPVATAQRATSMRSIPFV